MSKGKWTKGKEFKIPAKDPLRSYLKEVMQVPLLTKEEEFQLARLALAGDKVARQKLVEHNLRFVVKVAKRFRFRGLPYLDLINEGNLGLMEAVKRFDPERNVRLLSYAIWWIRQSILIALAEMGHALRLPAKVSNTLYKVSVEMFRGTSDSGKKAGLQEIAKTAGLSQKELVSILLLGREAVSLSYPIHVVGRDTIGDSLKSAAPSQEDEVTEIILTEKVKERIGQLLEGREKEVICLRFGIYDDNPMTLSKVGIRMGVSRERVRQIEVKALTKLRQNSQLRYLADCT